MQFHRIRLTPSPLSLAVPDLSVDVMDVSGESQLDVEHNLFKQRLTPDGRPITAETERTDLGDESVKQEDAIKVSDGNLACMIWPGSL